MSAKKKANPTYAQKVKNAEPKASVRAEPKALLALAHATAAALSKGTSPPSSVLGTAFLMAGSDSMDLARLDAPSAAVPDGLRKEVLGLLDGSKMPGFSWDEALIAALRKNWVPKTAPRPLPSDAPVSRAKGARRPIDGRSVSKTGAPGVQREKKPVEVTIKTSKLRV